MKVAYTATLVLALAVSAIAATPKVADLSFLAGHWVGQVGPDRIEQYCIHAEPTTLVCAFQAANDKGTDGVEFFTIRDTPTGIEERVHFFDDADIKIAPGANGVTMRVTSLTDDTVIFENPTGTFPKRTTLTKKGNDDFTTHSELIDAQGKTMTIDAHWTRAK
jgi:hypothetical protein